MNELTDNERHMLDFEGERWKYAGAKEAAVRERFELSSIVYYQRLNALLTRPEALAYAPMTVKRLVRLRDARRSNRSARRLV